MRNPVADSDHLSGGRGIGLYQFYDAAGSNPKKP